MTMNKLTLISHRLCPYVQRAVIALTEKSTPFERVDVDLANKPDWFKAISPLGKTPVLKVRDRAIFSIGPWSIRDPGHDTIVGQSVAPYWLRSIRGTGRNRSPVRSVGQPLSLCGHNLIGSGPA